MTARHLAEAVNEPGHEIPMTDTASACPSCGEGLTNDMMREHQVMMPPNAANREAVVLKPKNGPLCDQDALAWLRLARTTSRFVRPRDRTPAGEQKTEG